METSFLSKIYQTKKKKEKILPSSLSKSLHLKSEHMILNKNLIKKNYDCNIYKNKNLMEKN